jgi:senataxin
VLGHCPTLERSDRTWKDIISDARERDCLIEVGVLEAHSDARKLNDPPLQADVNYFTGPKGKATPKPPPKSPKKAAIESQPIPTTLVAARSIGSHGTTASTSLRRPHVSQSDPPSTSPPSVLMPARNPPLAQPPATTPGVSSIPPKPVVQSSDTKSSLTPSAPSEPTTGSDPKPAQNSRPPQPVKRPKQPPSIFIPKKVRLTGTLLTILNPCIFIPSVLFLVVGAEGLPTKSEHSPLVGQLYFYYISESIIRRNPSLDTWAP